MAMTEINITLTDIHTDEALTLVVGWKSGLKMKLRQISLGADVEAAFRGVISKTVDDLSDREAQVWAPDADLSPETYLVLSESDLGDAPVLASEHGGQSLVEALRAAENLEAMHPRDMPVGDLSFYALVVGDRAGERTAFLRRSNPRRGLKRGRIYSLLGDTLKRLEAPIFAFDESIDLVVSGNRVGILSQTVFAAMFRDQDTLARQIPSWVTELSGAVSIEADSCVRLIDRAQRDSRLRARLEAIVHRGHLSAVSSEQMASAMVLNGLDPDRLIDEHGNLVLSDEDIPQVLYFLNEDLFVGSLTSTGFRADKKAAR